jgi:hypothetical protein
MRFTLLACLLVAAGCTDQTYRFDFDEDGWEDRQDCDPADPDIHPEADDPVGDDIDQDCDGADGTAVPAVAISPSSPGTNDVLFLQVVTEAPSWSIVWSLDGEAQAAWNGQSVIPAEVTARGQTWTVEVTTVSALGTETAAAEASVEIVNTPPVATLALGLAPLVSEGELLTVAVVSEDPDGDVVSLEHAWSVDGEAVDGDQGGQLSSAYFDKGQLVQVAVTPTDGLEPGATVLSNTALVVNTPPWLDQVTVDPPNGTVQTIFTCLPDGWSDPDPADTEQHLFEWTVGGQPAGTGQTLIAPSFAKHDVIQCQATPADNETTGPTRLSPQLLVANAAPELSLALLEPIDPTEATALNVVGIGFSDADGDPEGYLADWYADNVLIATNSATLPSTLFDKGDVVHAEVRPFDGEALGDPVLAASVTVLNTVPELGSVSIAPATAWHGDDLYAVPSGWTDPDPVDTEGYHVQWFVDGVPSGPDDLVLPASFHARDAEVTVQVTPYDGEAQGSSVTSAPLTISNSPPSVAAVSILPLEPRTDDELSAAAVGWSDPDPADVEGYVYAWTVDAAPAGDGPTLDPSAFAKGQLVAVGITPDDGTGQGSPVTSLPTEIVNTPPGPPTVAITPDLPLDTDELTCAVTTPSVDADGDTVDYEFLWIEDGFATPYTTEVLPVEQTDWFEAWECLVTADDGEESGDAGSATVIIGQNCDIDGDGGVAVGCGGDDCDDEDPDRFAGNPEICNGLDEDCDDVADVGGDCPCDAFPFDGHTYLFCDSAWLSWADARSECLAVGYELVTVDSLTEDDWVYARVADRSPNPNEHFSSGWWIGLNDIWMEGNPEWASGAALTYEGDPGMGSDPGNGDCVAMGYYPGYWYCSWSWRSCGGTRRFVCEDLP